MPAATAPPLLRPIWSRLQRACNQHEVRRFRAGKALRGARKSQAPVMVLTTVGRRSGRAHENPVLAVPDGISWLLAGGNAGVSWTPDWVQNLRREPTCSLEPKPDHACAMVATELGGNEREAGWLVLAAATPLAVRYQKRAGRLVPVFRLSPATAA